MKTREHPASPFKNPREPRPKGAQKGVTKRDNGRPSQFAGARNPDGNRGRAVRWW